MVTRKSWLSDLFFILHFHLTHTTMDAPEQYQGLTVEAFIKAEFDRQIKDFTTKSQGKIKDFLNESHIVRNKLEELAN